MIHEIRLRFVADPVVEKARVGRLPHVDLADVEPAGTGRWNTGPVAQRESEALVLRAGDVAYARLRPYLRKTFLADQAMTVSTEFLVLRARGGWHDAFLSYCVRDPSFAERVTALVEGAKMPRAPWEMVRNLRVASIPRESQEAIVHFLDRECHRIAALMTQIEATKDTLDDWFDSVLYENFTRAGTNPIPFGRLATLHRGFDLPSEMRQPGSVVVVGSGGPIGHHSSSRGPVPAVVTGRYGSIGQVMWSDVPCWPLNTTLFVEDFKGNDPRYVFWALRAVPLKSEAAKSAVPGLHRGDVHRMPVLARPREQQAMVATVLDKLESKVLSVREELQQISQGLTEYRDALIAEAVSGRLDVSRLSDQQLNESARAALEGEASEVVAR